jgi:putative addiction module component (TIGR02574 family)
MAETKVIFQEALSLEPSEKARLVDRLLTSLDYPSDDLAESWSHEVEDRIDAFESGRIKSVPIEKVLEKYRNPLK